MFIKQQYQILKWMDLVMALWYQNESVLFVKFIIETPVLLLSFCSTFDIYFIFLPGTKRGK